MRGVVVLFEGLPPTVIDSQVLTHVRMARERLGIDIVVVAFACSRALFESSQARLEQARQIAGGEVYLSRGVRPALPASLAANRRLLVGMLDKLGPFSFVHARADYAAAVAGPLARSRSVPMLWDCRGDARAELRERFGDMPPFMKPFVAMRLASMRRELKIAGKHCGGACFVTPQLRDLMAGFLSGQPSWIIPCLALETEFFFDPALGERVRNELQIGSDEVVYVYSGSLASYQGFGEVIAAFRSARAAKQKVRLVILTPDAERARRACVEFPVGSVICRSVEHAQVNGYLNAADFGMLLRESTPVNHVAFPTKFAEYALTGLKIIMKNSPPSCVDVARALGNHVEPGKDAAPFSPPERAHCAGQATPRLGRLAAMATYAAIYKTIGSAHLSESCAAMPA
jgi:glycosyltransferase involved in cell wall biosynthesis